ncbi:MAG: bacteriohemerythrin [Deltaproteobacteria bacterium]|nr:bacteriohemerythrin [Deltaproteobacteria bacterium]
MEKLRWEDRFTVNIASIDAQHQKLIEMINDLEYSINHTPSTEDLASVLMRINKYSLQHFRHEEEILLKNQYAGLDEHKAQHQELIDKSNLFYENLLQNDNQQETALNLLMFLYDWWEKHILESDQNYAKYFSTQEILIP